LFCCATGKEKEEMGGREEKLILDSGVRTWHKESLDRPRRCRWNKNKTDLEEIRWQGIHWAHFYQVRDR
jgi:hypothetical protein